MSETPTKESHAEGRRRSIVPLVAGTLTWWAGLAAVTFWPPYRLGRAAEARGADRVTASLEVGDGIVARVSADGTSLWTGAVSAWELAAWIALPPLVMLIAWMWWSARPRSASRAIDAGGAPLVSAGRADAAVPVPSKERVRKPGGTGRSDP